MLRVVVMNAKGGCGKTTIATNLASFCASQGLGSALFDYDPQASSTFWVKTRPEMLAPVHGVAAYQPPPLGVTRAWQLRVPNNTEFTFTDTPAGYSGLDIEDRVSESDVILIPVLPSPIDIRSTADFIRDVLLIGKARALKKKVAIIINRARVRTKALEKLERFVDSLEIPVVGQLRDTQFYVHAAEQGVGVHELADRAAQQDARCWEQILCWLQDQQQPRLAPAGGDLPYAMPPAYSV
jgi:chromosome partitioning protein